jgi:hypothetical protein
MIFAINDLIKIVIAIKNYPIIIYYLTRIDKLFGNDTTIDFIAM